MTQHIITTEAMAAFRRYLMAAERRPATIAKYLREVQAFTQTLPPGGSVTKETVLAWKRTLVQAHAPSTVNGKLAALNTFFSFLGWGECRVKALRRQRELFRDPGRELHKGDYLRLLAAARQARNWRLYYLMETLASTGVRISELQ
ncbi:MAG: site-specific integrase, partial [Evtepia sp.]